MSEATVIPRHRVDALPEHYDYKDTGCSLAPSCLDCPLPKCRYEPGGRRAERAEERRKRFAELKAKGLTVGQIANALGMSRRNAFRMQKEMRAA